MPKFKYVHELTCPLCGKGFTTTRGDKKFCSDACRTINNRAETRAKRQDARLRERQCPGCGATFTPVGRQRFCSMRCGKRVQARVRLGIADPGLSRTCWWCGQEFVLLNALRLYCSKECSKFVKSLWNLSRYGITRDDYREAWFRQGGCCAVCHKPERTSRNRLLAIDHDHVTGRFRGLLCSHCNRAIGLLQDDPAVIVAAATYVQGEVRAREGSPEDAR